MKNLKIIQSCLVKGEHAEAGTTLENVDNAIAADLVTQGRAVEVPAKYDVIGDRDPKDVDNRDPKPGKKAGKEPTE